MGRKAIPTAIKILHGTHRPDRANPNEPKVAPGTPEPPEIVTGEARIEWDRLAPLLVSSGVLTTLDGGTLASYCVAFARWLEAERQIAAQGTIVKSPSGYPIIIPYLSISNRALKQMKEFGALLGLNPTDRSKIQISDDDTRGGILTRKRQTTAELEAWIARDA